MDKNTFRLYLFTCLFLLSGCHKDVFDPEAIGRDYFIQDIPEDFDWSTTSSVYTEITPDDQYNGQYTYTIEIFDRNPLTDTGAVLYATGWSTANRPFKKNITIPETQTQLFIRQTSPGGRKSIKETNITDNKAVCDFRSGTLALKSKSTLPTRAEIPEEIPAGAIEISGNEDITLSPNKDYAIKTTYNGRLTFPGHGQCSLYISGTWNNPASQTVIQNNSNIYIMDGGKLLSPASCEVICHNYAIIAISPGGQLGNEGQNNITLNFYTYGQILNEGYVYCNQIIAYSPNLFIHNKKRFYANLLKTMEVSFSFRNECYANIKTVYLSNKSSLYIAPGCAFICENLHATNSSIELDNSAMLVADKIQNAAWGKNNVSGTGNKFALIEMNELICTEKKSIIFSGQLHVKCKKYPDKDTYQILCIQEDAENGPNIEIKPTECSPGNNYIPEQPEQPVFPQKVTYTKAYTYASEDNYPSPGDYDMNDLTVTMDSVSYYYVNDKDDDNISRLTWHLTVRSVGATRLLGAAIQLDELKPDNVKSVIYSPNTPVSNFNLNSNGTEKGQEYAVIPLFDNAHSMLGSNNITTIINTISQNSSMIYNVEPNSFDITVEFSTPVDEDDVETDEFNYFVIVGSQMPRTEIHLPKYKHTDLSHNPKELHEISGKYMWNIKIPGYFRYPHEWNSITKAYSKFESWVQSNRKQDKDWYLYPNEEYLYKK